MDCLQNVIGLSRSACECYEDNRPVDYNTSLSGLFLADLVPLAFSNSAADCEKGGAWEIMEAARATAQLGIGSDILATARTFFEQNFTPFKGWISSPKFNSSKAVRQNGNLVGQAFKPTNIKGGKIVLQGVRLGLMQVANGTVVDVFVVSSADPTTVLGTATVTLVAAGNFYEADFDTPVVIDLANRTDGYENAMTDLEYYIYYQMPVGGRYFNNEIYQTTCTSCNGQMTVRNADKFPFLQYAVFSGFEVTGTDKFVAPLSGGNYNAQSLQIKADFGCNAMDYLCDLTYDVTDQTGGTHADYAKIVANAILYKAAYLTCQSVLDSGNINAYTIWETEKLYGKRAHFEKNYNIAIQWLAQNVPLDMTDCQRCKTRIFKTNLIS